MNRAKEVKCMKKKDLVAGKHVVQYRNGGFRFVGKDGDLKDDESEVVSSLMYYNARWEHTGTDDDYDIVAVYELNEVWKREEPTITEDEKAILQNIDEKYKYVARDYDRRLFVFLEKPEKKEFVWGSNNKVLSISAFDHLFKMVKWEDEEPWKIEDLLKLEVKKYECK